MLHLLTELPEWRPALELVIGSYAQTHRIPGREQLRAGAMLRAHLRGVLRRLARGCGTVHEVDRCSELERAEAHCARIDYLWTLLGTLEWIPTAEAEQWRARWIGLRRRLAEARARLALGMTWRLGDRPAPVVLAHVTRSLPAMAPTNAPLAIIAAAADDDDHANGAANGAADGAADGAANGAANGADDDLRETPSLGPPPRDTSDVSAGVASAGVASADEDDPTDLERVRPVVDAWVDELGSWLDAAPVDAASLAGVPHAERSTARLRRRRADRRPHAQDLEGHTPRDTEHR